MVRGGVRPGRDPGRVPAEATSASGSEVEGRKLQALICTRFWLLCRNYFIHTSIGKLIGKCCIFNTCICMVAREYLNSTMSTLSAGMEHTSLRKPLCFGVQPRLRGSLAHRVGFPSLAQPCHTSFRGHSMGRYQASSASALSCATYQEW